MNVFGCGLSGYMKRWRKKTILYNLFNTTIY
jgi:hypothetical protein